MKQILSVILLILIACNEQDASVPKDAVEIHEDSLRYVIGGAWGDRQGKPYLLFIGDSMYSYITQKTFYYLVHDDDIIILYDENPDLLQNIHTIRDTLFFTPFGQKMVKAYRVKQR